jgi:adenylylsulfate reductase subunit A
LAVASEKLDMLKEDAEKMRAKDLHELLRACFATKLTCETK